MLKSFNFNRKIEKFDSKFQKYKETRRIKDQFFSKNVKKYRKLVKQIIKIPTLNLE